LFVKREFVGCSQGEGSVSSSRRKTQHLVLSCDQEEDNWQEKDNNEENGSKSHSHSYSGGRLVFNDGLNLLHTPPQQKKNSSVE